MADFTLAPQYGWAVGETISVYATDARRVQTGAAVTTADVAADSTVEFTGLEYGTRYVATDGTRAVQFMPTTLGGTRGTVEWDSGDIPPRATGVRYTDWFGPDDPAENAIDGDTWTTT